MSKTSSSLKFDKSKVIEMAKRVHGDTYEYDMFEYNGMFSKTNIVCKKHGLFSQNPNNHIHGKRGCPTCANENRSNGINKRAALEFIKKAKSIHGDLFKYDKSVYIKNHDPITITCTVHGDFESLPSNHLRGHGCPYCAGNRSNINLFLERAREIHGDKYDYSDVVITTTKDKVLIKCPKHGNFYQNYSNHLMGDGCPSCSCRVSSHERELIQFLAEEGIDTINSYREIGSMEIDIISLSHKIGIEINGLYWHSDIFKDKRYHLEKSKKMEELGFRLIHIFEDDWVERKEICKSIILNAFKRSKNRIFARSCKIKEVPFSEAKRFLSENHIQGNCISKTRLGLFFNDELVSIMTFGELRKNLGNKVQEGHCELMRFCSKINTNVIGAASKLFHFYTEKYKPLKVISYCDKFRYTGNTYINLGFKFLYDTKPNYFYTKGSKRYNRFAFRKSALVNMGESEGETEKSIMKKLGYNRIYDCGSMKFEWEQS